MYRTTSTLSCYYQTIISVFLELKVFRGLRVHGEEPEEKHCFYSLLHNLTTTRNSSSPVKSLTTTKTSHWPIPPPDPGFRGTLPHHRRSCGRAGRSRGAARSSRSCPEPAEERERSLRGGGAAGPRQRRPEGGRATHLGRHVGQRRLRRAGRALQGGAEGPGRDRAQTGRDRPQPASPQSGRG